MRHRLQRVISDKYAVAQTLVAYLLDTDIETYLAQRADITDETSSLIDEDEQIIAAVQAESKHLPPTVITCGVDYGYCAYQVGGAVEISVPTFECHCT